MLEAHVLHLRHVQHAVLGALRQRVPGLVGVDMDLEHLVVLADDQRIADAVQVGPQQVQRLLRLQLLHDIHGIVGECDLLGGKLAEGFPLRLRGLVGVCDAAGKDPALQRGEESVQDRDVALAAGVDDARASQHGVLLRGLGQGLLAGGQRAGEDQLEVGLGLRQLRSGGGGHAGDGQDRALGRLHDRLVGGVHAVLHRVGELRGVAALHALQPLGDAPEQQRQDHAGIPARAAQHGAGGLVRHLAHTAVAHLAQLRRRGGDGQGHVGAGIAVRNRKHVQLVDGLFIRLQRLVSAQQHLAEHFAVDIVSQVGVPLFISR